MNQKWTCLLYTSISTVFVLSVAYCRARLRFKMRKPFMKLAMILGLFPAVMSMVAVYFILKAIGLTEGSMLQMCIRDSSRPFQPPQVLPQSKAA